MPVYETLQEKTLHLQAYGMFDGIPKVFATWNVPSAWETSPGSGQVSIGGELYDWDRSLELREGFGQVATRVNLKTGTVTSGVSSVRFLLPGDNVDTTGNVWFDLLARSTERADVAHASLRDNFGIGDTTLPVHSTTGWPAPPSEGYLGLETFGYTGLTSDSFTGVTRGLYRSPELSHKGRVDNSSEIGSGTFVRSSALAWRGRVFRLWLCFGEYVEGQFVPFGASIESTEDIEWMRGLIIDKKISTDQMHVDVEVSTLDQLLAKEVLTKSPKAWAGLYDDVPFSFSIYLDDTCNKVMFADFSTPSTPIRYSVILQQDVGGGTPGDVPTPDVYPIEEIAEYLKFTFDNTAPGGYVGVDLQYVRDSDLKLVARLRISARFGDTAERAFEIHPREVGSIWLPMGFEDNAFVSDDTADTDKFFEFFGDRAPARLYIPDPKHGTPARIYVSEPDGDGGPAFVPTPGWKDSDGANVNGFVKIGKECFEFNNYTVVGDGRRYLTIVGREQLGSKAKELYVEAEALPGVEKREQCIQGLVIPNTTAINAYVQALTSGSGVAGHNGSYDAASWEGSGANVSDAHCDLDAFTRVSRILDAVRYDAIATFKAVKMRGLMPGELAVSQVGVAGNNVYDPVSETWSGFLLQPFDPLHPLLHEVEFADVLDETNIVKGAPIKDEDADARAINTILVDALYDHGRAKFDSPKTPVNQVSFQQSYGKNAALKFQIRSIFGREDMQERLRDIVQPIFFEFGGPYRVLVIPVASFEAWGWGPGKPLKVTHTGLVQRVAAARGEINLVVKLMERSAVVYGPKDGATFAIVICIASDSRAVGISPGFEVASLYLGTEYVVKPNRFRAVETGLKDLSDFAVLEYVRFFEEGKNEAGAVKRQITAIDIVNSRVTFASALPASAGLCEFVDYDDADITDRQKNYAYICDEDEVLDLSGGGSDPCHRYS